MKFLLTGFLVISCLLQAQAQFVDSTLTADTAFYFKDVRDGKEYKAIRVGGQVWMAENLRYNTRESHCYNDSKRACKTYGRLYSWEEAVNACPPGWHLPTQSEWQALIDYCGGDKQAGKPLAYNNYLGFHLVFGYPPNINGRFSKEDTQSHFWTADENNSGTAFVVYFLRDKLPLVYTNYFSKNYSMMCRCVKDDSSVD